MTKSPLFNKACAAAMLAIGSGMAVADLFMPPEGEIDSSVLMFTAQCFIFAGSAMGIDVMLERKLRQWQGTNKDAK